MAERQRLVVCLDGTWNRKDSSTNVLHHFNVVKKGADAKGVVQKKYYHPGVGTGVLDSVTGGGFGFGLEQNVRDAYNWLVENYCDRDPGELPDEIYIFGFSRGAYTARSLVGFIGRCGLLRRGAPLTVGQLWSDYCILGRQQEERSSVWDWLFSKSQAEVRQMTELVSDPWRPARPPAADLNERERLLVRWSRRVRITYLGVYDTVGAIGWDALAIPGLTSRLALHNNMRPTTLIQSCRHALALDENRSSFNHTPFRAFVGYDAAEPERGGAGAEGDDADARRQWERTRAMWRRKIEQRWFVGAHSNVGGGYESNRLAERPFQWLLEGATRLGLAAESVAPDPPVTPADQTPRDSYAEFAAPLWTKIIRAKRNYRAIDPDPVPQARAKAEDGVPAAGFSLETIHEDLDDSVTTYWKNSGLPLPPNLAEYAERRGNAIPGAAAPAHVWLNDRLGDAVALVIWATAAAAGLCAIDKLTDLMPQAAQWIVVSAVALLFPLVDWSESAITFRCALGAERRPRSRAFLDAVYWMRALGFVLFAFGAAYAAVRLARFGWRHQFGAVKWIAETYWPAPVAAAAVVVALKARSKSAWASFVAAPAVAAIAAALCFGAGWCASTLFPEISRGTPPAVSWGREHPLPGLLLLLQLALLSFWRSLLWTAEPLAKANLGSVLPLQWSLTPSAVAACLERWRRMLACEWSAEDPVTGPAAVRLRELLGQALWRDIIGFIPVYSVVFLFGLWLGASLLPNGFPISGSLALWWAIPLVAAATDYIEDACHLRYCQLHEMGKQPSAGLTVVSWSMSRIKEAAFLLALLLTIVAVFAGSWQIRGELADWRAKIVVLLSVTALAVMLLLAIATIVHAVIARQERAPKSEKARAANVGHE